MCPKCVPWCLVYVCNHGGKPMPLNGLVQLSPPPTMNQLVFLPVTALYFLASMATCGTGNSCDWQSITGCKNRPAIFGFTVPVKAFAVAARRSLGKYTTFSWCTLDIKSEWVMHSDEVEFWWLVSRWSCDARVGRKAVVAADRMIMLLFSEIYMRKNLERGWVLCPQRL